MNRWTEQKTSMHESRQPLSQHGHRFAGCWGSLAALITLLVEEARGGNLPVIRFPAAEAWLWEQDHAGDRHRLFGEGKQTDWRGRRWKGRTLRVCTNVPSEFSPLSVWPLVSHRSHGQTVTEEERSFCGEAPCSCLLNCVLWMVFAGDFGHLWVDDRQTDIVSGAGLIWSNVCACVRVIVCLWERERAWEWECAIKW